MNVLGWLVLAEAEADFREISILRYKGIPSMEALHGLEVGISKDDSSHGYFN